MTESHRREFARAANEAGDFDIDRWYLESIARLGTDLTTTHLPATIVQHLSKALAAMFRPGAYLVVTTDLATENQAVAYSHGIPGGADLADQRVQHTLAAGPTLQTESPTWMGAPIVAAGRPYGAVCVMPPEGVSYDETDLAALCGLTSLAGLALQSANLFELLSVGKREWEATVDSIPQAFCIVDDSGRVRRGNLAFCELVGVPVTAVAGRPWQELLPREWRDRVGRVLALPVTERLEGPGRVHLASALKVGRHGADHAVLIFDDVTDREELEDQLAQSAKMTAIGQLVSGVAHDLNGPLSSIAGLAEYLTSGAVDIPAHLNEPIAAMSRETERAASIVGQLLSFARKNNQVRSSQRIEEVLESTLSLLKNLLLSHRVETVLSVEEAVPPVLVNFGQIQQVFVNLINNAAQAIAASGRGDRLVISVRSENGESVAVTFSDNGPGIEAALRPRIFEPFFTTRSDDGGTGLGLSISSGIISEHGGRLTLAEPQHDGATFLVILPAAMDPGPAATADAASLPPRNILVVDGDPHMLGYLEATLKSWGHTVQGAATGAEAVGLLDHFPAHLIVSELRMPDSLGRPLYERLLSTDPELARRILFTIPARPGDEASAFLQSLGRPHLRKPFTLVQLREALAAIATPD